MNAWGQLLRLQVRESVPRSTELAYAVEQDRRIIKVTVAETRHEGRMTNASEKRNDNESCAVLPGEEISLHQDSLAYSKGQPRKSGNRPRFRARGRLRSVRSE